MYSTYKEARDPQSRNSTLTKDRQSVAAGTLMILELHSWE